MKWGECVQEKHKEANVEGQSFANESTTRATAQDEGEHDLAADDADTRQSKGLSNWHSTRLNSASRCTGGQKKQKAVEGASFW